MGSRATAPVGGGEEGEGRGHEHGLPHMGACCNARSCWGCVLTAALAIQGFGWMRRLQQALVPPASCLTSAADTSRAAAGRQGALGRCATLAAR